MNGGKLLSARKGRWGASGLCTWPSALAAAVTAGLAGPLAGQEAGVRVPLFMDFRAQDARELFEQSMSRVAGLWEGTRTVGVGRCPAPVEAAQCFLVASSPEALESGRYGAVVANAGFTAALTHRISLRSGSCSPGEAGCIPRGAVPYVGLAPVSDASTVAGWWEQAGRRIDCDGPVCRGVFERAEQPDRPGERALLSCETGRGEAGELALPRSCYLLAIESPTGGSWAVSTLGWGSPTVAAKAGFAGPLTASLVSDAWNASVIRPDSVTQADVLRAVGSFLAASPLELEVDFWLPLQPLRVRGRAPFRSSTVLGPPRWFESVEIEVLAADDPSAPNATAITAAVNLWVSRQNDANSLRPGSDAHFQVYEAAVITGIRDAVARLCGTAWSAGNVVDCTSDAGDSR
ncbi:MAG TPA: hypothetical protein VE173_03835 [Longimicrobiales bacterium]|nr:hypothetical protein [Longimicrobiales bacterium]